MKNIEEFCLELKNDILKDIGDDRNWDTADYTMRFYGSSGEGGLTILEKNNQEVRRIHQERFLYFWDTINLLIDRSKINKGTLTIYPNGEYESSFIWDEAAYLGNLRTNIDAMFAYIYHYTPIELENKGILVDVWDNINVTIPFKSGKIQLLNITIKEGENISYHPTLIENFSADTSFYMIEVFETAYQQMNEGKLKNVISPKWNTAIVNIDITSSSFDFKRDVSFEWREENA